MVQQFKQNSAETTGLYVVSVGTTRASLNDLLPGRPYTHRRPTGAQRDVGQDPWFFYTWSLHEARLRFSQCGGLRVVGLLNMVAGFLQRANVEADRPS